MQEHLPSSLPEVQRMGLHKHISNAIQWIRGKLGTVIQKNDMSHGIQIDPPAGHLPTADYGGTVQEWCDADREGNFV